MLLASAASRLRSLHDFLRQVPPLKSRFPRVLSELAPDALEGRRAALRRRATGRRCHQQATNHIPIRFAPTADNGMTLGEPVHAMAQAMGVR